MDVDAILTGIQDLGYAGDAASEAIQTRMIASRYRHVNGMRRWPWTEAFNDGTLNTTAGEEALLIGSALGGNMRSALDSVRIYFGADRIEVKHKPIQEIFELVHTDRTPGTPEWWALYAGQIFWYPIPDKAYELIVAYKVTPDELTTGSDEPVWPEEFHDILKWGAAADWARRQRDWDAVNQYEGLFVTRVNDMLRTVLLEHRQNASHIGIGFYDTMRGNT